MGRLSKIGGKIVKKHRGDWNQGKMMLSKTMEKQWKKCGIDVRPLAMEKQWKNRGTMMKKWSKTMEKQWKNCGSDVGRK